MSFLDQLAFGPGRDRKAWTRILAMAIAVLAVAIGALYVMVAGDLAFLKASIYTGTPSGEYYAVGERLAARALNKNGHLRVVATAGSVENITYLADKKGSCVPVFAFVQDGIPIASDAGLQTLGRLPQPESLLIFARRGRAIATFGELKGASVGIGPDGSGTAYLMRQLLENSDLKALDLRPTNHQLEAQAELVRDGQLDLAAFVMNENAELIRTLINKYDLEIVAPADMEGLVARDKWLRLGKIPAGFYDVARPIPAADKLVAQVDTLIMTNACTHRAERLALLTLLSEQLPNFVRSNPPPSAKSQDAAPLADEARQFFANGQPELADRYFPRLVNLMSPAYWIYLAMAVTILFNASNAYSRFRLWRIDATREMLESRLKALSSLGSTPEHVKSLPPEARLRTLADRKAAEDLMKDLEALQLRCEEQTRSMVTPMGREMYYRYQQSLIKNAQEMLGTLLRRSNGSDDAGQQNQK
jgi:TRAP transporter TAXI family solute receptor